MSEEELESYNPAATDQHKLGTIFSKKELKKVVLVNLFFIIFTVILYLQYTQNPECPQSENANQCWDMRPILISIGMMGTLASLILLLFSLFRNSRKKE
tara:strand:+ start:511 stop:807 length:297 start_codon:yes stop_codon:yes gene_type:complete